MLKLRLSTLGFWIVRVLLAIVAATCAAQAPAPEPVSDQETELGQAVYKQLRDKGEIIESSPLYDSLKPVAEAIARVAQSRYPHPVKFFLVHETQPNAHLRFCRRNPPADLLLRRPRGIRQFVCERKRRSLASVEKLSAANSLAGHAKSQSSSL